MKNKTTTVILAFFLGGIGIHRFYLGNIFLGILYLVFSWTLIPSLIALIDFIVFLITSETTFNKKYNALYLTKQQVRKESISEELEKLNSLREKGIITNEEFEVGKKQLIN
ncbi:MAG: NINE protein [Sediminibacterium sp.]|nr:NINE protein [Sediminibacterium sp.]